MKKSILIIALLIGAFGSFGFILLKNTPENRTSNELEATHQSNQNVEIQVLSDSNEDQWN